MSTVVARSHTLLPLPGGDATRILIIDDDPRRAPPGAGGDAVSTDGTLPSSRAPVGPFPDADTRPVVHEYQIATPVPLAADVESSPEQVRSNGTPDVSMVRELMARVEELLHHTRSLPGGSGASWSGTIRFGTVVVEPATQTVLRDGQPLRVTHTEFRLLLALIRRRGAIASRVELLREVWGVGAAVSRRAVDTHIARLRRKLEEDPANPRHILTALAWGYRFRP